MTLFKKILVANRGEIACRIIKTARKLGIATVGVYSEIDAQALHVKLADEAYSIGPAQSSLSYLDYSKIIAVAQLSKAEAIHPGYGFLSENAEFADACEKAGIIFVGPSSQAIRTMGEKHLAKDIMKKNGIPVLPDYYSHSQRDEDLWLAAEKIGFPLLIKAVAGGGGKGLRLVNQMQDFKQAISAAKREAKASFNDERILIEKYLNNCRHVEVQIIADHHHNVVHLFERDCSIQRKHQKIIEEAPAPKLSEALKQNLYQAALQAAKSIEYKNAGTVEFLVSNQNEYFFMEMNTRLQVEHPITEMITGIDLVEWQFRIAAGEKLPIVDQTKISCQGHAFEARINAEDPSKDFIPATGKLVYFKISELSQTVRVDTGYSEGDNLSVYYDSLIAKLIVHGKNRADALSLLKQSLNEIEIAGITSNLFLLKNIVKHSVYQSAQITTQFLEANFDSLKQQAIDSDHAKIIACLARQFYEKTLLAMTPNFQIEQYSPWFSRDAWRLNLPAKLVCQFETETQSFSIVMIIYANYLEFVLQEKIFKVTHLSQQIKNNILNTQLEINHQFYSANTFISQEKYYVYLGGESYIFQPVLDSGQDDETMKSTNQLRAPMPGTIVEIMVNEGQKVTKGDKLLVIEAMKMEHIVYAPRNGVIQKCYYTTGDSINEGSELLEISSSEEVVE